ncbi:SRPBCC family protein [Ectobacillus sp. sgz5001026]|uniref:SRPBCC family protein n=1 Tax=Ectobacillus sp. sgz5001026 TaxID=3242473 RepID=UPI0036D2B222
MEENTNSTITVEATVHASVEKVWTYWTEPEYIKQWSHASDDWHTTHAENDLRVGGKFSSRMEAKDGSFGFDFGGTYDEVQLHQFISYTLGDGRKVSITFEAIGNETKVVEEFEAEAANSIEMQQSGWQAILDNFKKRVES